jgi:hypothetical protein
MKRITLIAILLSSSLVSVAGVYKWTDAEGNIHFGDKSVEGAEKVKLQPPVVAVPQAIPLSDTRDNADDALVSYKLAIASPAAQETIRSAEGKVNISLTVDPLPKEKVSYKIFFDGQEVKGKGNSLNLFLSGVVRGTHQIRALMVDESGKTLAESKSISFYLRQPSINNPAHKKKKP